MSDTQKIDEKLPRLKFLSETASEFVELPILKVKPKKDKTIEAVEVTWNPETEELVRKVYQKRNCTTFQLSYGQKGTSDVIDLSSNELMNYFASLFEEKTNPVLRPPESSRQVFGCLKPDRYYIQLSTYQDEISRKGYDRLKNRKEH